MCPGHEWCGYGGPSTGPTARALASRRCALWPWREGVSRWDASRSSEGHLRSGARPPLAARPQGGLSGSATHVLWARACGRGGQALSLRDAGSNSHEFAPIRIRPEFARICRPLRTRIRNFKFESSVIRLSESIGTYNLPSRLQFTCLHMGMPLPSTISHKRFPKSFRNLAIFVVCCCLHLPC